MGTILDTTVFISLERAVRGLPQAGAMGEVVTSATGSRDRQDSFDHQTAAGKPPVTPATFGV
jgi:hypothetical protein